VSEAARVASEVKQKLLYPVRLYINLQKLSIFLELPIWYISCYRTCNFRNSPSLLTMNPTFFQVFTDPDGDVDLVIQGYMFVVSSSKMSAISPEFLRVFTTYDSLLRKTVELPNEDPLAFHLICQLAHVAFIPEAHISLETLVKLADIIQRYDIPSTSVIHKTTIFCFNERTRLLETVSMPDLIVFLQVAKDLGSAVYIQLLEDAFLLYPFRFEALPVESNLRYLVLKGAACRTQVANMLFLSTTESLNQNYLLVRWILYSGPSLRAVRCQLDQEIEHLRGHHPHQLLEARRAISQAIADVGSYIRHTAQQEVAEICSHPVVKWLKVQIAYGEHNAELSSSASSSAAVSPTTEFENIDAYTVSVDEEDDKDSITSRKTT
jgi:hypothetical protein